MLVSSRENLHKSNDNTPLLHSGRQLFRSGTRLVCLNFFFLFKQSNPKRSFQVRSDQFLFPPMAAAVPLHIIQSSE